MASLRSLRTLLISSTTLMVVNLAAAAWTEDSLYLTFATSFSLPAMVAAFLLREQKKATAANEPPPREGSVAHNAVWTFLFLVSAVSITVFYHWRLDSIWTVSVLFLTLFLLFMGLVYAAKLTRQLRSPRSPSHGP